jgi:YidC/Oxa1 family membrane protein insertase
MDRRVLLAITLMMLIVLAPSFFMDRPAPRPGTAQTDSAGRTGGGPADQARPAAPTAPAALAPQGPVARTPAIPADTVHVRSDLYDFGLSTVGATIVSARMLNYPSQAPADSGRPAELVRRQDALLGLTLVHGRDTVPLAGWRFTPSDTLVTLADGSRTLTFTGTGAGLRAEIRYTFSADDYRVKVDGRVAGLGADGGLLLVDLGEGIRNTEANLVENRQSYALVTKQDDAERTDFTDVDAGTTDTLSGPFEWAAVKSKYFVTALFAVDSAAGRGGRLSGVTASVPARSGGSGAAAKVRASLPVSASGAFDFAVYTGPLEYDRLSAQGNGFDDVNPYGWPGFRTLIRFFAVPVRYLLVWMHESIGLSYGLVLVVFGLLVRIVLWPLNQKAMRSSMAMQAIQPEVKRVQERFANDPQRAQQEMFKLYKEHGVNPFGGCWPMLLPMPVLLALFFVFQNTIELRGASFLWIPDLAQYDPTYVIPVLMAASMFLLSWVGQRGMEPNPQAKMMMYMMPAMMFIFFFRFASGLNLYYAVSNFASIPQQILIANERKRRMARAIVEVKTKEPAPKKKRA